MWLALALIAFSFLLAISLVRAGSQADAAMRSAWDRQTGRPR